MIYLFRIIEFSIIYF